MSSLMPPAARLRRRAILCVLGSSAAYTVAAALVKAVAPGLPTVEIVLFRSLFTFLCLLPLIQGQGGWRVLRTQRPLGHLLRLAAGFTGMVGSFYGYAHLPLATVTALGFSMPIFLTILSVPLLGERVTRARAGVVAAGLLGVLMVIRPWRAGLDQPLLPSLIVVFGVGCWAVAMISIRRMGQSGERSITITLLFALMSTVLAALLTAPVWVMPGAWALLGLVGVGVISAGAQWLMTEGYRSGEATMLAPFEYGAILYTTALGWLVWSEVPGGWEVVGIAIIVGSGLFAWWREGRGAA